MSRLLCFVCEKVIGLVEYGGDSTGAHCLTGCGRNKQNQYAMFCPKCWKKTKRRSTNRVDIIYD